MEIILASASPRRKEILSRIVPAFTVVPSGADEHVPPLSPADTVEALACMKAESVFEKYPEALVIGADTVVAFEGKILGKPADREDAVRTLRMLSGQEHEVFTGWCILAPGAKKSGSVRTAVRFRDLDEGFIREYADSGKPLDKAGSYGIQDDERLVAKYSGSFTNVVGFPEEEIREQLKSLGCVK